MLPESYDPADLDRLERRLGAVFPPLFRSMLQNAETHDRYRERWWSMSTIREALQETIEEFRTIGMTPVEKPIIEYTRWLRQEPRVRGEGGRLTAAPIAWVAFGTDGAGDLFFLDTSAEPYWVVRWFHDSGHKVERIVPLSRALDEWLGPPSEGPPAA